jgi:hypothetical protein
MYIFLWKCYANFKLELEFPLTHSHDKKTYDVNARFALGIRHMKYDWNQNIEHKCLWTIQIPKFLEKKPFNAYKYRGFFENFFSCVHVFKKECKFSVKFLLILEKLSFFLL